MIGRIQAISQPQQLLRRLKLSTEITTSLRSPAQILGPRTLPIRPLGRSKAARVVGRACATNPVSLVMLCHQAVGTDGAVTGYRWGVERKKALLEREKELTE
jgi:hypothetical protein